MKDTRKIERGIRIGDVVYTDGQEDEIAVALPAARIKQLVDNGSLSGDWVKEAPKPDAPELKDKTKESLKAAGLLTVEEITATTDEALIALNGIGEATVKEIRSVYGPHIPSE